MSKKAILLLQEMKPEQVEALQTIAPEYVVVEGWGEGPLEFPLDDIEITYGWDNTKGTALLDSPTSQLKWIHVHSAGVDYLDLDRMKEKNIILSNSSGIHGIPIAETVFGMLLSYTRGIRQAVKDQSIKKWDRSGQLIELRDCTIMIVGTGSIGSQVGRLAKAFGMKTIGVNRSGSEVEYMDCIIKQPDLIHHLQEADIIINILPLTDLTHYFFNKSIFSQMKNGTMFINVGRGQTVKTDDLIEALDAGNIAFAGLDVFESEPLPSDDPLWDREDVLITPHISGMASHFKKQLFAIFEENLKAYINGNDLPRNKVEYDRKY